MPFCRLDPHAARRPPRRERCARRRRARASSSTRAPSSSGSTSPRAERDLRDRATSAACRCSSTPAAASRRSASDAVDLAERYPARSVILAHAGICDLAWIWRDAADQPNLFFDTAWWNATDLLTLFCAGPAGADPLRQRRSVRAAADERHAHDSLCASRRAWRRSSWRRPGRADGAPAGRRGAARPGPPPGRPDRRGGPAAGTRGRLSRVRGRPGVRRGRAGGHRGGGAGPAGVRCRRRRSAGGQCAVGCSRSSTDSTLWEARRARSEAVPALRPPDARAVRGAYPAGPASPAVAAAGDVAERTA